MICNSFIQYKIGNNIPKNANNLIISMVNTLFTPVTFASNHQKLGKKHNIDIAIKKFCVIS